MSENTKMKPYAQYKTNGTLWRAGKSVMGLCAAYNHATNPQTMLTENEHKRSFAYAKAIKNRLMRLGFQYIELSNGMLFPKKGI